MHGEICIGDAVNWDAPLNRGLRSWWLALPGQSRGVKFRDLCLRNHGTLVNGPAWIGARGRTGGWGALDFPGSGDSRVETSLNFTLTSSVAFWLYARTVANFDAPLIENNDVSGNFHGFLLSSGQIQVWNNIDSAGVLVANISANTWYRVLLTRAGNSITNGLSLYLNGKLSGRVNTGAWTVPASGIWLGNQEGITTRELDGLLDGVKVWNRALSASEASADSQDALLGYPATLNWLPRRRTSAQQAAGGFQSAWAYRSNVLIYPGVA